MYDFITEIEEEEQDSFQKQVLKQFGSEAEFLVGVQPSPMHDELFVSWSAEEQTAFVYASKGIELVNCGYKTNVTSNEEAQAWGEWICGLMQNSGGQKRY